MAQKTVLAVDLGAESGRVMAVHFDGQHFQLEELHRFPNGPVAIQGTLYWDILRLWTEVRAGIEKGSRYDPAGIGVDTWGVDFGLLDRNGQLLSNPVSYRDDRTEGMMDAVFSRVPKQDVFTTTGIQFARYNTLYQLMSLVTADSPLLAVADTLLLTPDLLTYWLTGEKTAEHSIASTTQMLDVHTRQWAGELLAQLNLPDHILPPIVSAGTQLGSYQSIPVFAVGSHDTASAVAAVPAQTENFAYISSGTWSLFGLETRQPIVTEAALAANVTNEGGVYDTVRLLQNLMGLWIVQQCRKAWQQQNQPFSYGQLVELARAEAPLRSLININDPVFLPPGDHPHLVGAACARTRQPIPESPGAVIRTVLESLALGYRATLEALLDVSGRTVDVVHIVGGGIQNELLNQMAANSTGRPVIAGPLEATVIGNALVQLIAMGDLRDLAEGRSMVGGMSSWKVYEPDEAAAPEWDNAYLRYQALLKDTNEL
jgi:rhamnulokinase